MTHNQAIGILRGYLAVVDLHVEDRKQVQEAFDVLRQPPGMSDVWAFKAGKRAMQKEVLGVIEEALEDAKRLAESSAYGECAVDYVGGIKTRIQQLAHEKVA